MNTRELIKILSERNGRSQKNVKVMYNHVISGFRKELSAHHRFTIPGLGTFGVREHNHRKGYNPLLKAKILIPRKIVGYFRSARALKEAINREQGDE